MKKSLVVLLLVFIISCGKRINNKLETIVCKDTLLVDDGINHEICKTFIGEQIISIYTYKDSLKYGPFKKYYSNGNLREKGEYLRGKKIGFHKVYDNMGKLLQDRQYIIYQNEEYLNFLINYDSLGIVDTANSRFYQKSIKPEFGMLGDSVNVRIKYFTPKSKYTYALIGETNIYFRFKDGVKPQKIEFDTNNEIRFRYPCSSVGNNVVTGIIYDSIPSKFTNDDRPRFKIMGIWIPFEVKEGKKN